MAQDQNIIQIRDAFMLAKRQYELTPELLADIDARRLYHALINISTLEQFDDWLAEKTSLFLAATKEVFIFVA